MAASRMVQFLQLIFKIRAGGKKKTSSKPTPHPISEPFHDHITEKLGRGLIVMESPMAKCI